MSNSTNPEPSGHEITYDTEKSNKWGYRFITDFRPGDQALYEEKTVKFLFLNEDGGHAAYGPSDYDVLSARIQHPDGKAESVFLDELQPPYEIEGFRVHPHDERP